MSQHSHNHPELYARIATATAREQRAAIQEHISASVAIDRTAWQRDWAVAPGEILQEALEDRDMSQSELARRMDRPVKTINEIVHGKAAITPDTALQLELTLGVSATFWNNLETAYREQRVAIQEHLRGTVMDADLVLEADKESGAYHDWKRRTGRTDAAGLAHEMQDFGGDE